MDLVPISGGLARVLPYLAHGNTAAQAALLDHYTACLDLAAFDNAAAGTQQQQVQLTDMHMSVTSLPSISVLVLACCVVAIYLAPQHTRGCE